ncbi:DUF6337 family protein [Enterobacteriaceae bacterium H16N7]|nr:DUF6337 family protein [Dryocola clanedunensis]
MLFYLVGLTASISCAFAMAWITRQVIEPCNNINVIYSSDLRRRVLQFSFVITLLCCYFIYRAWSSAGSFVSDDFESSLTFGLAGHMFSILVALIPFVLKCYHSKRTKTVFIFIIFILFLLFMKQVKYWVMIPLVWIFWYSIVAGYIKISLKKLVVLCLVIAASLISLFFSVYFMKVVLSNGGSDVNYSVLFYDIMIHFFGYLYSGILTFSVFLSKGMYTNVIANDIIGLFAGPLNLINVFLGEDLLNLTLPRTMEVINSQTGTTGNVPTIWGTLLLAAGYYSYVIYFLIIFFASFLQWMTKYSSLYSILYTFMTTFLFFSWFDYYYYLLMPFEVFVLCSLFYFIFEVKIKRASTY